MKIGNKIIIEDITKIESKMSYNTDMVKLVGSNAKITNKMVNCYNGKTYYKLDIDLEENTWSEEWLKAI